MGETETSKLLRKGKTTTLLIAGFVALASTRGLSDPLDTATAHTYLCPNGVCPTIASNVAFSSTWTPNPASTSCTYYIDKYKAGGLTY